MFKNFLKEWRKLPGNNDAVRGNTLSVIALSDFATWLDRDAQLRNEAERAGALVVDHIIPCGLCGHTRETNMSVIKACPHCGDAEWQLIWQR